MPVYAKDFEPIAKPSENVCIIGAEGKGNTEYYKIVAIEPLPFYEHDFGAVNAGQTLKDQEVKALYLNAGQLAQYRIRLVDDVELQLKQPKSDTKFTTKSGEFKISRDIAPIFHCRTDFTNLTEFFVFEDQSILFNVTNPSDSNIGSSKVQFAGFKYILEELDKEPDKYTTVIVEAQ